MGARSEELAQRFEAENRAFIAAVEPISEQDWLNVCPAENWSVGVTAHHVAAALPVTTGMAHGMAEGKTPDINWDMLNQANAEHARAHANCTKNETLAELRTNGDETARVIRSLEDDALDAQHSIPMFGPDPITTEQFIQFVVIGNYHAHLPSIRAAAPSAG